MKTSWMILPMLVFSLARVEANGFDRLTHCDRLIATRSPESSQSQNDDSKSINSNFSLPQVNRPYDFLVTTDPVATQCSSTCTVESGTDLLEGVFKTSFSTDYNTINSVGYLALTALKERDSAYFSKLQTNFGGYIETSGISSLNFFHEVISSNGVLLKDEFHFSEAYLAEDKKLREELRTKFYNLYIPNEEVFSFVYRVGRILQRAKEAAISNNFNQTLTEDLAKAVQREIDFARGSSSGIIRSAKQTLSQNFSGKSVMVIRQNSGNNRALPRFILGQIMRRQAFGTLFKPWSQADIEKDIQNEIKNNRPVMFAYNSTFPEFTNQTSGEIRLPPDFDIERIKSNTKNAVQAKQISSHSAIIGGLKFDSNGEIEWLLVKDSNGLRGSDKGYLHMRIEFFRAMLEEVTVLKPI